MSRKRAARGKTEAIKVRFGRRVRELRERLGWTQGQLARAAGISLVFLGTLERGEKSATLETVEKVAEGLQVRVEDLLALESATLTPDDRFAIRVAALARSASEESREKFVRIARIFFEGE